MNSSSAINTLYGFFGQKKNKLLWSGSLEDLKAFFLTIIDESTAQNTTWHSPSGGKWCFDSEQLKVTWYSKSGTICFDGANANVLCEQIHRVLSKPDYHDQKKDQNSELNKSIECFMADASLEASNMSSDETPRLCTSLLQVRNISCLNINENECDGVGEKLSPTHNQQTDEQRSVIEQSEFGHLGFAHRGLLGSETTSIGPVTANGSRCCADCVKQSQEIDKLQEEIARLKKYVFLEGKEPDKSCMDMQITRLQRDNSTLINTVEMLSKQLLNQREGNSNNSSNDLDINLQHMNVADEPSTLPKEKNQNKKKKKKENRLASQKKKEENKLAPQSDNPLSREEDKDKASADPKGNANNVVAQSSRTDKQKQVVVIAGDSLIKNLPGTSMSRLDADHFYVVKSFPGATVSDMEDYIKLICRKSPEKIILHVGTNDLKNSSPKVIADSILNLATQIKEDSPISTVGVSALLDRNDCPKLATKVKQVNLILDDYCHMNKIPFLRNRNTNISHLNSRGLHLNKQSSLFLQNNFCEFINNLSN